jgi:hypothetical protein
MKEINPDEFLKSDKPEEVVLGILAGKYKEKPKVFSKVIRKISKIVKNKKELLKYMEDISFLGGLFDVEIKLEPMPIQIDIRKTLFYKWGERKGFERGLKEAISGIIQAKFGSQKVKLIKNILDKIDDIDYLKKIKKEAIRAKTWEDFIKVLKTRIQKTKTQKVSSNRK